MTTVIDPALLDELEQDTRDNHPQSALAQIGGPRAVVALVAAWDARLLADPITAPYFELLIQADRMSDLQRHQVLTLIHAFGGADRYTGRDLRSAHRNVTTIGGTPITETVYRVAYLHCNDVMHDMGIPMVIRLSAHELLLSVQCLIVASEAPEGEGTRS